MCIADSRIDNSKEETKSFYTHVLHQPTLNPTSACNQIELCQTACCSSLNCWTQQQRIILQCSTPAMNAVACLQGCAPLPLQLLLRVIKLQQQKLSSAVCGIALHCIALHVEQISGQELHCKRYICSALHTDVTAEKRASADITGVQRPIALQRYIMFEVQCGNRPAVTAAELPLQKSRWCHYHVPLLLPISLLSSSSSTTTLACAIQIININQKQHTCHFPIFIITSDHLDDYDL